MTRTTKAEFQAIVERINRMYADELTDETEDGETVKFTLFHSYESGVHRAKITPSDLENGGWESNLGPGFSNRKELEAFLRGLEYARDIDRKAEQL